MENMEHMRFSGLTMENMEHTEILRGLTTERMEPMEFSMSSTVSPISGSPCPPR